MYIKFYLLNILVFLLNEKTTFKYFKEKCKFCSPGSILEVNLKTFSLECSICPNNTFSIGNDLIRYYGKFYELQYFLNSNILNNTCESNNKNIQCSNWTTIKNGYSLISGNIINNNNIALNDDDIITSRLLFLAKLQEEGSIKLKYHFITKNVIKESYLEIYINYGLVYKNIIKEKDKLDKILQVGTYPLNYGDNTIYIKFTKNPKSQIDMIIDGIKIKGGISSNKCVPCINSYSYKNSSNCIFCEEGEYWEKNLQKCVKCPFNKTTKEKNSIGIESCIEVKEKCKLNDYITLVSPICSYNKNQIITMKLNKECYDDEEILKKINEKNPICEECPIGLYKENKNSNEWFCSKCHEGYYYNNNTKSCLRCDDNSKVKNISYFYPPFNNQEIALSVFITDNIGEIEINYLENTNITLFIDDKEKNLYKNKSEKLNKGQHYIKINLVPGITIRFIKITNTLNGFGFSCMNINQNYYKNCPSYKEFYFVKEKKCVECPELSRPNNLKTHCEFISNIVHTGLNLHYDLFQIKENAISIRQTHPEWVNGNFYGPLTSKMESNYSFYIYNYLGYQIENNDFKGYIYKQNFDDNKIISVGSIIEFIKIINSENNLGLIIKYSNGDKCENNRNYSSIFFLKCRNTKYYIDLPKMINYSNCTYYFEMYSRAGCPICLDSQIWKEESKCYNKKKRIYNFEEEDSCIISNREIPKEFETNNFDLILNETDIDIISNFQIENLTKSSEKKVKKYDSIIYFETTEKKCSNKSKYIKLGQVMIIIYFLIILFLIIWKKFGGQIQGTSLTKLPNFIYVEKSKYDRIPVQSNQVQSLDFENNKNNNSPNNVIDIPVDESPVKLNEDKFIF